MSEPRLISPILDNFAMGDPISDHNGVRCCPAIDKESNDKYIVKIISTPASQTQLDALLLTGAFNSVDSAKEYFKTLAEGVVEEASVLDNLSKLEGFIPYKKRQTVPMDDAVGFDVYILSAYHNTLAQLLRHKSMTHLSALNLALDMCAALSVCRRSGYLYVDLKPENIYLEQDKPCRIGDIGFLSLKSLQYASLPERYRSQYTAPEISDAYASINTTIDIYALGLILYQIFNDGLLPPNPTENNRYTPPAYADYELAEIILKACSIDPSERWTDPVEMGQALVSYMQRNGVHDTPIGPVATPEVENDSDNLPADVADASEEAEVTSEAMDTSASDPEENEAPVPIESNVTENPSDLLTEPDENTLASEATYLEAADGNLSFLDNETEEAVTEGSEFNADYSDVSSDTSDILSQVDELISHPTPTPVIPPEPIDVPIPEPCQSTESDDKPDENTAEGVPESEPEFNNEPSSSSEDTSSEGEDHSQDNDPVLNNEVPSPELNNEVPSPENESIFEETVDQQDLSAAESKPHKSRWILNLVLVLILLSVATIGILLYTRYYLQPIDSIVLQEHENGDLTVFVSSPIDETKLVVICVGTDGKEYRQPVKGGKAVFTGLPPDSAYTVQIVTNSFHKLTGDTSSAFTTPAQTNISQCYAITGSEDGSVILSFDVEGPDSTRWKVIYKSANSETKTETFTGHQHTVTGLTVGEEYLFTFVPETDLNYAGNNTVTHIAQSVVVAQDIQIISCIDGNLSIQWTAPEGAIVDSWTARCSNDTGYDKSITVTDTSAIFDEIDFTCGYIIEITANGMTVSSDPAYFIANTVTITDFVANETDTNSIILSWNSNGFTPESGWILNYTIDSSMTVEITGITDSFAEISPQIPGAIYDFELQTPEGNTILYGTTQLQTATAKSFSGYGVKAKDMEFKMCNRPSKKNWDKGDLSKSDYTTTFKSGKKASFLIELNKKYNTSKNNITSLFVIRNQNGEIVSVESTNETWTKMWKKGFCELDIPSLPKDAGKYTLSVYFNGAIAHTQSFKITK